MKKKIIYDYYSLNDIPITKWNDNFFWPVSRDETQQFIIDIRNKHYDMINQLGNTLEGDCLLIAYHLPDIFIKVFNILLFSTRMREADCDVQYSDKIKLFPKVIDSNEKLIFEHENLLNTGLESYLERRMKNVILSAIYNAKKGVLPRIASGKKLFSFGEKSILNRPFTQNLNEWIHLTSLREWVGPMIKASTNLEKVTIEKFNQLAEILAGYFVSYLGNKFGITISNSINRALLNHVNSYLEHIAVIYRSIRIKVAQKKIDHILTPTGGITLVRALSCAVRANGGKVTGFPHGYFIGHSASHRPFMHEFATVNEFITYTPGSVSLMNRNAEIHSPPRENKVSFINENNPVLLNTWNQFKIKTIPSKIKTVMLLEAGMQLENCHYDLPESMVTYHFYNNICQFLSKNGYHVIFKRRPKSPGWNGINIFNNIKNLEMIYEPFEKVDVIDRADAIIVQYGLSSTLYYSMCTNKTVIYADAGWEPWFEDVYKLMSKRCRILNCWYDERNRQCFDEETLKNILQQEPEKPNTEFLEKYLFPENFDSDR